MKSHEFLQIECDYHFKSKNRLERGDAKNIVQALFKLV